MLRVSTFGQQTTLLQNTMRNQERLFVAQQQITTGKKATSFRELSAGVQDSFNARQMRDGVAAFRDSIAKVRQTVETYDLQLERMAGAARGLENAILDVLGSGELGTLGAAVEETLATVASGLGTRSNGQFIFSGARTDSFPLAATTLAELAALTASDEAFVNDGQIRTARIDEDVELAFGITADGVASKVMEVLKRFADFGPVTDLEAPFDPLNPTGPTQREFLEAALADAGAAARQIEDVRISNGLNGQRLAATDEQHADREVFLEILISDIEDVDMAEAISRFNQDQVALEASFAAMASLQRLSLLNFI